MHDETFEEYFEKKIDKATYDYARWKINKIFKEYHQFPIFVYRIQEMYF